MEQYAEALKQTDPATIPTLDPGSEAEKEAIQRFTDFYQVFSAEIIRKDVRSVYAETAYFADPFKEVQGIQAIEEYFLKSAEAIHECTFDIQDVAIHEGNYYFRWVMHLITKREKDEPVHALGMSHVRFNRQGMVSFHQDYWDSSIIYEKVPVMGWVIRWIRGKF